MADRLLRWLPLVLVCGALAWVARRAAAPVSDPDDWWHLRLGNDLIGQRSLSAPDHWSVFATVPWVPTEPVPEVVSAYVERWFGLPGLAVLFCAAGLAVVATIFVTNRAEAALLPSAVATVFTVLASVGSMTSRPQLVSFVLLPIVLGAWLRTERDLRPRWWLVPLLWCWSLCHGFWVFGVAYGLVVWAGIVLSRRADRGTTLRLLAVAVASGAVVALNPLGLRVLEAPFVVNSTSQYIAEWARTDFGLIWPLGAVVMILGTAVIWGVTREGVSWARVLILLSACFLVWDAVRLVIVAALVMSPLFARALTTLVERSGGRVEPVARGASRRELTLVGGWAVACLVVVAVVSPQTSDKPGDVPVGLDAALDRLPAGTRVFNDYDVGGWMAWRHPDLEHYIDGLVTPYSVEHVDGYGRVVSQAPGWYAVVQRSGAEVALLRADSAAAAGLRNKGWTVEGTDDGYALLSRPAEFG